MLPGSAHTVSELNSAPSADVAKHCEPADEGGEPDAARGLVNHD